MFLRVKNIVLKRLHPLVILGVSLAAVMLVTAFTGIWHHHHELSQAQRLSAPAAAEQMTTASAEESEITEQGNPSPVTYDVTPNDTIPSTSKVNSAQPQQQSQAQTAQDTPNTTAAASAPTNAPASVTVTLNINDNYKGKVTLAATSNQCDVLQKALDAGVIASLDMRYSSQYKTHAVYMIEGQGDSGSIWWAYTVNGKSPPYGCSGTKVAEGDSTNWKYVKQ